MLGIRSLAAELVSDPALVLNNAELSRVCWKKGPNSGELIVEVDDYSFGVLDIRQEIYHEFDMESDKGSGITDQVPRIGSPVWCACWECIFVWGLCAIHFPFQLVDVLLLRLHL